MSLSFPPAQDLDRADAVTAPGRRRISAFSLRIAQILAGGIGLACLFLAIHMDEDWTGRHVLPDILVSSDWLMMIVRIERIILVLLAAAVLLVICPRIGRIRANGRADPVLRGAGIGLAVLLAIPVSEALIRAVNGRASQSWNPVNEPLRHTDPLLGWANIPARRGVDLDYPSRPVYFLDRHGYRVAAHGRTIGRHAPSIMFLGESILFGKGLDWSQTVAGRVESSSRIQSANLSVPAYSASQVHLLLKQELPKFRRPVAVVILFGPDLMSRDLDRSRPWVDRFGRRHAPEPTWRLSHLSRVLFPYHSPSAVRETVENDRCLLMADVAMVRARGAQPIILVPIFQPEQPQAHRLRTALFRGTGMPHVVVPLDRHWRLFPDFHPDARANEAMARAVWMALQGHDGVPNRSSSLANANAMQCER
ncbi:hypothetical protein DM806_01485 [Sphingobium lactosutens]|uniref:hypothetical protein n=1 Tax=Sphingobium lactosutens TaxID=522773 RepID=UPI0015BC9EE7|nr:hypothetical protein [Sphingobium lactosutens]NWK94378.1 hypothetical protein [Sphingobium lactosutens]